MTRVWLVGLLTATIVFALPACGGARKSGICGNLNPDATGQGDAKALEAEGDAAFAKRDQESQLRKAITSWEKAMTINPSNAGLRVKLARAHYFLADGHLSFNEEAKKEMLAHYQKGTNHAELALGQQYPKFRSKYCSRQPFKTALQQLDTGAIGAMYWYSTNLGKYALATSIVEVLNQKDRIKAMMELIKRLDAGYFHGAADRYFGAFYTKIPFPKGDIPKSAGHFEASMKLAPDYLSTRVLYAAMNRTKAGDRAKFKELLDSVVNFDLSKMPEMMPENKAEQRKAKDLLEEIDVYFPED